MMCSTVTNSQNDPWRTGKWTSAHCYLKLEQFAVSFVSRLGGNVAEA